MARKNEFDPLGGSISCEKPIKAKKNNSILGSIGHTGSSSVYDEMDHSPASDGWTDALTVSGESNKPKKKGLFSRIFGQKKSPKESSSAKSGCEMDDEFKDDPRTPDTKKYSHDVGNIPLDDIFKEPDQPSIVANVKEPHPTRRPAEEPQPKKQAMRYHPNICYLCGADSATPHQQFKVGEASDKENAIPLCKTCMRAVTTLMKYRDPLDEREIKSEWRSLAPGLDEKRADDMISEARRNI
ncbi:MAG TPA: hypothetical protein VJ857_00800 [Methanocorpusculum sp.]|nr:hypothetical protein [Methanocorpusculum sp.]HKL97188.1 hypothetical protein [Methanocorpusculum sp.]